eukprot:6725368-Alexandrium_andersonii.AAC.1
MVSALDQLWRGPSPSGLPHDAQITLGLTEPAPAPLAVSHVPLCPLADDEARRISGPSPPLILSSPLLVAALSRPPQGPRPARMGAASGLALSLRRPARRL